MSGTKLIIRLILTIWTLPNTLLGISIGMVGLLTGGRLQIRRGCFEFYGGFVSWLLERMPPNGALAMTLGHTIIGLSTVGLKHSRDHEHVHVKQYERWGPFFIPAYLLCSFWLWICRRDYYYENPFEVEAYGKAKIVTDSTDSDDV